MQSVCVYWSLMCIHKLCGVESGCVEESVVVAWAEERCL